MEISTFLQYLDLDMFETLSCRWGFASNVGNYFLYLLSAGVHCYKSASLKNPDVLRSLCFNKAKWNLILSDTIRNKIIPKGKLSEQFINPGWLLSSPEFTSCFSQAKIFGDFWLPFDRYILGSRPVTRVCNNVMFSDERALVWTWMGKNYCKC